MWHQPSRHNRWNRIRRWSRFRILTIAYTSRGINLKFIMALWISLERFLADSSVRKVCAEDSFGKGIMGYGRFSVCGFVWEKLSKMGKNVENLLKSEKMKTPNSNNLCYLRRLGSSGFLSSNPQAAGSSPARRTNNNKGLAGFGWVLFCSALTFGTLLVHFFWF